MHQVDSELRDSVRKRLFSCVRVSHGIVIDREVFIEELRDVLTSVFNFFFPQVDDIQRELIHDSLRREFILLTGEEIKTLVVQETGYFRAIVWPRIEGGLCRLIMLLGFLSNALYEVKCIRIVSKAVFGTLFWLMDAWISAFETVLSGVLPKSFLDKEMTWHHVIWIPIKDNGVE